MGSGKVTQKERLEQVETSLAKLIHSYRTLVRCIHSLAAAPTGNPGPLDWKVLREMTKVLSAHGTTLSPAYYCSNPSCPVGCPDSHALPPSELDSPDPDPALPVSVDVTTHSVPNTPDATQRSVIAALENVLEALRAFPEDTAPLMANARLATAKRLIKCTVRNLAHMHGDNDDTALLDYLADTRVCDGYGGFDIDELTLANMPKNPTLRELPTEEAEQVWKLEWRKQFRYAIRETMKADKRYH